MKKKVCEDCGFEGKLWTKTKCKFCADKARKNTIRKVSPKKKAKNKVKSDRRSVYFNFHIERCLRSEESQSNIPYPSRFNIAHLIDKGRHPSVQDNLDNYVYLTVDEHTDFDNLLFKHRFEELEEKFPNAWKVAVERIRKILPSVKENTKFIIKLKEYLDIID